MKIYLNAQYKCVKVEDNTFVANSTSNFIRYYFVQNADGTLADEITESTEVYLNQEPSYVTLGFRRADGNTIQHLMATPKTEGTEAFWEYVITETDGVLYKKGALEVSAQFINATLNSENKIISQKVMAVAINTAHILDNIGEEAEEYYSQYEQANNEAHAALQAQITEKFNNIGVMGSLTTDNKNTLVEAINEVDEHADKAQNDVNKLSDDIGDKLSLTTDEKNTIVGAINEVDEHADTAQTTADSASQTANNAKTVADTAKSIADSASQTANLAKTTANNASATANAIAGTANQAMTIAEQAKTIATNSVYSVSFEDIQSAVTALNGYDNAYFKVGNSIYLKQKDVPDMWVYAVASEYVEYTYTTDDDFVNALLLGTVQVGYYVLANLESTGDYDVLKDIPIINQDLSADGFTPVENTYYRHTGTTSETYTAGVVYFYNGTAYKAIDGAGGEVPTSLPATGAKITGNLPTSGWASDTPSWIGQNALTWTEIDTTSLGFQHGGYFVQGGTKDLGLTADKTYTISLLIDGTDYNTTLTVMEDRKVIGLAQAGGVNLQIVDHAISVDENLNYTDGNGYVVVIIPDRVFTSIVITEFSGAGGGITATISNSAIKTNSAVTMYIDYSGKIKAEEKTDGSITVSADETPTENIPYTLQVVETSAEGAFEIVNSYLPSIPETPTALPQTASALKSGKMTRSGWAATENKELYNGKLSFAGYQYNPSDNGKILSPYNYTSKNALQDWSGTIIDGGSIEYCKIKTDNEGVQYVSLYWNSGAPSHKNREIQIYNDGTVKAWTYADRSTTYDVKIVATFLSDYVYTISDADVTTNSDIFMEITDANHIVPAPIESGKIKVISSTVPSQPIPYTYKVKQTNASGQFTVLNHYVPSIPESPTSLPVSYKKASGELPTSGWTATVLPLWEGNFYKNKYSGESIILPSGSLDFNKLKQYTNKTDWQIWTDYAGTSGTYKTPLYASVGSSEISIGNDKINFRIKPDGSLYAYNNDSSAVYFKGLKCLANSKYTFAISDTFITANASVKMYLTDEGGVKAYSKESGTITVIRDTVPTTAIPYEYEVEETSAEGLFEVINAYVPTKTSELTNDSGFITTADIPSATTLYEDSTGAATVTLSETINNGDIVRIKTNNGNVDHYYIGVAWNRTIMVTESFMVTDENDVTVGTAINIDSLRFNIQDTSLILSHYFNTNITTAGAVTITNEKANVVIRKVERIHT